MKVTRTVCGKIIKGLGGLYTVRLSDTDGHAMMIDGSFVDIKCRAKGAFRYEKTLLLVGDDVSVSYESASTVEDAESARDAISLFRDAVISEIGERKNSLIRPPMSNIDYIFITMASAAPAPLTLVVDKLISIAEYNGIEPIIVISKAELDTPLAERLYAIYSDAGFKTFMLSCFDEHFSGADELRVFIEKNITHSGKIAAFAGASGVGKSTIMNKFFPSLKLFTSDVSRKTERGRHTTRHVELYPIENSSSSGYIADTPGFSMLDFDHFDFFSKEDLPLTFREFENYIGECKYRKCTHTKEEGCAILEALGKGEISPSRHESFLDMYSSLKDKHSWQ